jgi:antitoxin HicB
MSRKNPHSGSDFDDFLKEEGILAEAEVRALKYVIALGLRDLMSRQKVTKSAMASRMSTSRAAIDRLLDGHNSSVTLGTLNRAARALGRKVKIELVSA